jgi:hypothetical protein
VNREQSVALARARFYVEAYSGQSDEALIAVRLGDLRTIIAALEPVKNPRSLRPGRLRYDLPIRLFQGELDRLMTRSKERPFVIHGRHWIVASAMTSWESDVDGQSVIILQEVHPYRAHGQVSP